MGAPAPAAPASLAPMVIVLLEGALRQFILDCHHVSLDPNLDISLTFMKWIYLLFLSLFKKTQLFVVCIFLSFTFFVGSTWLSAGYPSGLMLPNLTIWVIKLSNDIPIWARSVKEGFIQRNTVSD